MGSSIIGKANLEGSQMRKVSRRLRLREEVLAKGIEEYAGFMKVGREAGMRIHLSPHATMHSVRCSSCEHASSSIALLKRKMCRRNEG